MLIALEMTPHLDACPSRNHSNYRSEAHLRRRHSAVALERPCLVDDDDDALSPASKKVLRPATR